MRLARSFFQVEIFPLFTFINVPARDIRDIHFYTCMSVCFDDEGLSAYFFSGKIETFGQIYGAVEYA